MLRADGKPVEGLFAAGRVTAGLAVEGYASGISLGDSTYFGRRAGRVAATRHDEPLPLRTPLEGGAANDHRRED